ncbi:uncharacterized protein LOC104866624 isoform X2 [Fukomys damarensis]|uniref:uncharacterized protein LOC104866624 isoform X2 n=1 Tax=Fukomys damarensis TaxID=885580 RepID=UPI001455AF75|nr:uncharacterized protein LOC104866624 isoform X2 [Fukomys damarensis]
MQARDSAPLQVNSPLAPRMLPTGCKLPTISLQGREASSSVTKASLGRWPRTTQGAGPSSLLNSADHSDPSPPSRPPSVTSVLRGGPPWDRHLSLVREHQCPPQEEPAFPPALGSSSGLVLGVWKNCSFGGSLGHSLQGSQEDTKGLSRRPLPTAGVADPSPLAGAMVPPSGQCRGSPR